MSDLVPPDQIEEIVGRRRHPTEHLARAVSADRKLYILHSTECATSGIDLRACSFSQALDRGIDPKAWAPFEDRPVRVTIDTADRLHPTVALDQYTDEQIEAGITLALRDRNTTAVPGLVQLLALQNPDRAETVRQTILKGLAIGAANRQTGKTER